MKHTASSLALALALVALPAVASAYVAVVAKTAHLRAGPSRTYPVVAVLPAGIDVEIQGCLRDFSWCDVVIGVDHGWIYAGNLKSPYEGGYVPLLDHGPASGIAVIAFVQPDYWGDWYRDRPFYDAWWMHRPRPGWGVDPGGHPRPLPPPIRPPRPPEPRRGIQPPPPGTIARPPPSRGVHPAAPPARPTNPGSRPPG